MFYNDTYGLATTTQSTVYQRIPQVFNLAVNGWLRTFIGGWWCRWDGEGASRAVHAYASGHKPIDGCSRWDLPEHRACRCYPPTPAPPAGNASANLLGVQEAPKASSSITLDFSSLLGPLFFTWVVQMLLPIFLMQLVYEKEKR